MPGAECSRCGADGTFSFRVGSDQTEYNRGTQDLLARGYSVNNLWMRSPSEATEREWQFRPMARISGRWAPQSAPHHIPTDPTVEVSLTAWGHPTTRLYELYQAMLNLVPPEAPTQQPAPATHQVATNAPPAEEPRRGEQAMDVDTAPGTGAQPSRDQGTSAEAGACRDGSIAPAPTPQHPVEELGTAPHSAGPADPPPPSPEVAGNIRGTRVATVSGEPPAHRQRTATSAPSEQWPRPTEARDPSRFRGRGRSLPKGTPYSGTQSGTPPRRWPSETRYPDGNTASPIRGGIRPSTRIAASSAPAQVDSRVPQAHGRHEAAVGAAQLQLHSTAETQTFEGACSKARFPSPPASQQTSPDTEAFHECEE